VGQAIWHRAYYAAVSARQVSILKHC
jgi:hypothetical protein